MHVECDRELGSRAHGTKEAIHETHQRNERLEPSKRLRQLLQLLFLEEVERSEAGEASDRFRELHQLVGRAIQSGELTQLAQILRQTLNLPTSSTQSASRQQTV